MELSKASIRVNGSEIAATIENNVVTIPCEKEDIIDIDFTTETSIEAIPASDNKEGKGEEAIYDVYGRRVYEMQPKHVYIQNGEKTLMK